MCNIKFLIACLFISASSLLAQSFNPDSCILYYKAYEDDKLKRYLDETSLILEESDKVIHHLYSAYYFREKGDKSNQLSHLTAGYNLYGDAPDSIKWLYLDELSITYRDDESIDKKKSFEFIDQAISLKKSARAPSSELARSYHIKGNCFNKASGITASLDSAIHYYQLAAKHTTDEKFYFATLSNIAVNSIQAGKTDSANILLSKVMDYYAENGIKRKEMGAKLNMVTYHVQLQQYEKADSLMDVLHPILIENDWHDEQKILLDLRMFSSFHKNEGWDKLVVWNDSIFNLEKRLNATRLDDQFTKFQLENRAVRSEALLQEEKAKVYRNRFWMSIFLGATATMAMLLIGIYNYLGMRRRAIREELNNLKVQASLDTTKAKMEGEQKERESIASVLHDQVASLLTAADMHIKVAQRAGLQQEELSKAGAIIKDVNEQVRDLSHQLVSPTLTKFGLEAGLETLVGRMETAQLEIDYHSDVGEVRFGAQIETFIFQSCAELIQNVLKHSSALSCTVDFTREGDTLILEVQDNGDNADVDKSLPTGLGLTHIYNRAKALGGSFNFQLRENGAISRLTIPLTIKDS